MSARLTAFVKSVPTAFTAAEISSFAEHLRVLEGEYTETELLQCLRAALGAVERETNRIYRSAVFVAAFSADRAKKFALPVFPVTAVESVADADGEVIAGAVLHGAGGSYYIEIPEEVSGDILIRFTAGYSDDFPAPECFLAAIFALAADFYEHRTAQSELNLYENRAVKYALNALRLP